MSDAGDAGNAKQAGTAAHGGEAGDRVRVHAPGRLSGRELVVLQLLSRGYTTDQVAALRDEDAGDALTDLHGALVSLGVATVTEAIAHARARGLIL
jgi:DNA-binding CsgD family transcriptional regulator